MPIKNNQCIFNQESFVRKAIFITFQKNPSLISNEELQSCVSYKLGSLNLTKGLGTTVKKLFNWLDKPLKKTLTEMGGIKAILQKFSNDADFERSVMVLKYMKTGICSGYASVDLAKKLEIVMGRKKLDESDDITRILKWNTAESITDPLLNDLVSSVRSLFFSSELNGNLSIEENFVDTDEALRFEAIRFKKIKRKLEGLGLITKSNFLALLEQLNRYQFPIGLQLSACQHSINIVKIGNIFTASDPDGDETNNLEKSLVEFVNTVFDFLEVIEKNYCTMSIVLYLPIEIKENLLLDLYDYFSPERKRISLLSVNRRVEDRVNLSRLGDENDAVLEELERFSDYIVNALIFNPLFIVRNFKCLTTHYPHSLTKVLEEKAEHLDIFEIHSRDYYLNSFLDTLLSLDLREFNDSSALKLLLSKVAELAFDAPEKIFQFYLHKLELWFEVNPSVLNYLFNTIPHLNVINQFDKSRFLALNDLISKLNSDHEPPRKKQRGSFSGTTDYVKTASLRIFPLPQEENSTLTMNLRLAKTFGFNLIP